MYKQNGKIDELTVYMVPIADISECGHSYEGSEINFENKVYANVKSNMTLNLYTPIVLYCFKKQLRICDGWHRWKIANILRWKNIASIIFPSLKSCYPTPNIRW